MNRVLKQRMALCAGVVLAAALPACGGGEHGVTTASTSAQATTASPVVSSPASGPAAVVIAPAPAASTPIAAAVTAEQYVAWIANVTPAQIAMVSLALPASPAASMPDQTPDAAYVKVADEGRFFNVNGTAVVRFGDAASNTWATRVVSGGAACSNAFFGRDPLPRTVKTCEVPTANTLQRRTAFMTTPTGQMPAIDVSAIPPASMGTADYRVQATDEIAPTIGYEGAFRTGCGVSKISFDDPIVFPGQTGRAHLHTFFGNTGVDANSTPESLRTTGTSTCTGGIANRSAYWVPTMIDTRTGKPVPTGGNGVYYKTGGNNPVNVHPLPAGLRMIAGDPSGSRGGLQGSRFKCLGGPNDENDKYGSEIANCDAGASLILEIFFPQCWDGVNFDSPDHKSHMAYVTNLTDANGQQTSGCPADHPVAIPSITFNVSYTVPNKDDPLHWRLSSDNYDPRLPGGYSAHGDWFNGWKSEISDAWGKFCDQAAKDCHSHLVGDGRMMY